MAFMRAMKTINLARESKTLRVARRLITIAFVALAATQALSGCISAEKPLSARGERDDSVLGHWRATDNKKEPMELQISATSDGWYQILETEYNDGKPKVTTYRYFPTVTKAHRYSNLEYRVPIAGRKNPKEPNDFTTQYMVFRYDVRGKRLTVERLSYEKLAAAIKAKKLEGKAWRTTWGDNVNLQGDSTKLLKLLESKQGNSFFEDTLAFKHEP